MTDQTRTNGPLPTSGDDSVATRERLARNAHLSIDAAFDAVHPKIDHAADRAHRVAHNADDLANHAVDAIERVGARGEKALKSSSNYMRDNPLLSLGVALTAGYVLNRLLASRKTSHRDPHQPL